MPICIWRFAHTWPNWNIDGQTQLAALDNYIIMTLYEFADNIGTSPPIDYTIQKVIPSRVNRTLFVLISILATIGIVLAVVFLSINIKFRNQRWAIDFSHFYFWLLVDLINITSTPTFKEGSSIKWQHSQHLNFSSQISHHIVAQQIY